MLRVTEMTQDDIDGIIEVETECFATPWTKASFEMELKNKAARYVVAKVDDMVVGYGGVWLIVDEGHVTNIGVRKSYRGQNIGSEILGNLINICIARSLSSMTLEVRVSNIAAKKLYTNHGFKEVGIRPNYYAENNEDASIMWLRFQNRIGE